MLLAIYLTVGLSILLHGVTAAPLAKRYGRWYEAHPSETRPSMEGAPATVTRPRSASTPPEDAPNALPWDDETGSDR